MTPIQALLLGMLQGVAEFLPISSSGHLMLCQMLFGFEDLEKYVVFDLVCHLGTLFVIFYVFAPDIRRIFVSDRRRLLGLIVGTLPLFLVVPMLGPIKGLMNQTQYLGYFFLATALVLFLGERYGRDRPAEGPKKRHALAIGLSQAIAVLPGISRSGSTISMARLLGWTRRDAMVFSFLLAVPAVLGGISLEVMKMAMEGVPQVDVSWLSYLLAFGASLVFGWFALQRLIHIIEQGTFIGFAWYCAAVGLVSLVTLNIFGG